MSEPCANCGVRHRNRTVDECIDREMTERTLQDRIVGRAKRKGWKVAHAGRGIAAFDKEGAPVFITPMPAGWPDLFMLNGRMKRVLVIECKREEGEVSDEQIAYLKLFNLCGIPAIVVKPSDLREGRVNAVLS